MPYFALICRDKPDHLQTRMDTRERHLAFLNASEGVTFAGPLLEDGAVVGSLLVLEADSLDTAHSWAAMDPYAEAGLFASVEILEWKRVIG